MFDLAHGAEPYRAVTRLLKPVPAPALARTGGFALTGVTFTYPHAPAPVLEHLGLQVRPGERLAVVGRNGAGKTTLAKLLTGLYTPTYGSATTSPAAVVFQDFVRYPLPLRDNVRLGDPAFAGTDADVLAALTAVDALDLLHTLPAGLDTPLSRAFTGGRDLSGGQWQKVALARAVYAMNAGRDRALIVDEPTAHLDARAEREVFERLLHHTRGRTLVLISHRFATVRRADRIVVLDGGAVAEQGGHAELVAAGGHYAHWYRLQADLITRSDP
nr:ATP-binding cassette domain-containing protein [Nonomuraea sp. FMUSA5-5]